MIDASTNFHQQFDREIKRAIRTTERFSELATRTRNWWPGVRRKLKDMMIENIRENYKVPISAGHLERKRQAAARKTKFQRLSGGPYKVIEDPNINWRGTGTMEEVLTQEFISDKGTITIGADIITLTVGASTNQFLPDAATGFPYPEVVDEELVKRGGIGLGRLTDSQVSEILKLLVDSYEKLGDKIMRGTAFGEPA